MSIERRRCPGFTLIELIVFIVIVSVGLVGILAVFNVVVMHSADPMIRKNMLSIAEALLEEVEAHPYCLQTDSNCAIAPSGNSCGATPANRSQLGQIYDYAANGGTCSLSSPIDDVSTNYFAPPGYSATIGVTAEKLNGADADSAARITVTVTHGADSLSVEGYRARYWPNQDQSW